MNYNIRTLKPNEIECRAQIVKKKGCSLLLYKDARCDMKILDETFGAMNWQRKHRVVNGNLFCDVQIWDEDKEQWITKEDVGVESRSEAEKGQASDSFKRACFNVGIGRELYTSPFVWVSLNPDETYKKKDKYRLKSSVNFEVKDIGYNEDREINQLVIVDQNGNQRYSLDNSSKQTETDKNTSKNKNKKNNKNDEDQLITDATLEEINSLVDVAHDLAPNMDRSDIKSKLYSDFADKKGWKKFFINEDSTDEKMAKQFLEYLQNRLGDTKN